MKEKIRSFIFLILIFGIGLVNLLNPTRYFSPRENRYLARFPEFKFESLLSGKFTRDFESYSTDQFIARDFWIGAKTMADLGLLKKDNSRVYFARDNYLIDKDEPINQKQFEKNMDNINSFIDNLKGLGNIDIRILLIPSKSQILGEKMPAYAPRLDEKILLEEINKRIEARADLKIIDLMDALEPRDNDYIYYRTDHHWTSKGALYAYRYFMNQEGIEPLREEDFQEVQVSNDFYGTSYRKSNLYFGPADKIYRYDHKNKLDYKILINQEIELKSLYDESYLDKADKYSYFFGGDKALIEIESQIKNGKSILIFKDSFANSFIPFLINHYERITIVDSRYYNRSPLDLFKYKAFDQVIFLYNIQNFVQEKSFNNFTR